MRRKAVCHVTIIVATLGLLLGGKWPRRGSTCWKPWAWPRFLESGPGLYAAQHRWAAGITATIPRQSGIPEFLGDMVYSLPRGDVRPGTTALDVSSARFGHYLDRS